jgi:hypothetical protein
MSKIDTLLKKAITFEKLVLYGDRKSYLQAIAQELDQVVAPGQKITFDPSKIPAPSSQLEDKYQNIPAPPTSIEVPEETIKADVPAKKPAMDPSAVYALQIFLNKAFQNDIIAGKKGPIGEDYKWGPETAGRLQEWGRVNKIPATNMQSLINTALKSAKT